MESPIKSAYNQPKFNHFKHLTVREVAGIKEQSPFGFEPYFTPKHGLEHRVCSFAPSKSKNISFIDIAKAISKTRPAPHHLTHKDWRKESIAQKGRFGKYKKITMTQEVFDSEKK